MKRLNLMTEFVMPLLFLLGGVLIGFILFGGKQEVHLLSERINACEDKGGKFSYYYSDIGDKYYESCRVIGMDIDKF